jgi:hypothetical protein
MNTQEGDTTARVDQLLFLSSCNHHRPTMMSSTRAAGAGAGSEHIMKKLHQFLMRAIMPSDSRKSIRTNSNIIQVQVVRRRHTTHHHHCSTTGCRSSTPTRLLLGRAPLPIAQHQQQHQHQNKVE